MKNYKKYPKYKDSGVEWIGDIPEGWDLKDFKYIFKYDTGGTPPSKNRSYYDGNNFWVTIEDLNQRVINNTADKITDEAVKLFNIPLSPKGALLISFKLSVGIVSFAGRDLYTNEAIATILPQEKRVDLNYWYYVFANYFINNANENIYGAKLFNQRSIKNSLLAVPDLDQQNQISAFLDKEIMRINKIVEKQNKFIELLKEKRAAVITHAVTKGLDPKVKLKSSGVEWIGDIPENWDLIRLKYLLLPGKEGIKIGPFGSAIKLEFVVKEGYKIYGQENVIAGDFGIGDKHIDDNKFGELQNYEIRPGDMVLTMMGTIGDARIVPEKIERGIMDSHLIRMRFNKNKIETKLIQILLHDSAYIYEQFKKFNRGSIMEGLNSKIVKNLLIALPPRNMQDLIIDHIESIATKYDKLISLILSKIDLLNEYKKSLIMAAVTGKIDVRETV